MYDSFIDLIVGWLIESHTRFLFIYSGKEHWHPEFISTDIANPK